MECAEHVVTGGDGDQAVVGRIKMRSVFAGRPHFFRAGVGRPVS